MTEAVIRNKAGMASIKDMPVLQDGPPPGGFAPVRFARRIPNSGPSAMAIFLTTLGVFSWGMYQVGKGNKIRRLWTKSGPPIIMVRHRSSYKLVLQEESDPSDVRLKRKAAYANS